MISCKLTKQQIQAPIILIFIIIIRHPSSASPYSQFPSMNYLMTQAQPPLHTTTKFQIIIKLHTPKQLIYCYLVGESPERPLMVPTSKSIKAEWEG